MENIYDSTPHDWLGKDSESWQRWVNHIATNYPTFAETVNSIRNPLYEEDVFNYFEEDTYKGVVAALLWLNTHRKKWKLFQTIPSFDADRIRYCVNYVANLIEENRMEDAFYSLLGSPYNIAKIPADVETCFIIASPPWEMLHFIGYQLSPNKRPPILDMRKHFSILKEADPRLAFHWYSEWKDGRLEADMGEMDIIYFDYCKRIQNQQ